MCVSFIQGPLSDVRPPNVSNSMSMVLNSTAVLVVWIQSNGASSYSLAIDRVTLNQGASTNFGGVVTIIVSFCSFILHESILTFVVYVFVCI